MPIRIMLESAVSRPEFEPPMYIEVLCWRIYASASACGGARNGNEWRNALQNPPESATRSTVMWYVETIWMHIWPKQWPALASWWKGQGLFLPTRLVPLTSDGWRTRFGWTWPELCRNLESDSDCRPQSAALSATTPPFFQCADIRNNIKGKGDTPPQSGPPSTTHFHSPAYLFHCTYYINVQPTLPALPLAPHIFVVFLIFRHFCMAI